MALFNPFKVVVIPLLLLFTFPLAIFAGITSTLAFGVLLFRVFVVYLDLALSLFPKSLFRFSSTPTPQWQHAPAHHNTDTAQVKSVLLKESPILSPVLSTASLAATSRRRRRRPSSGSLVSAGPSTPVAEKSDSATNLGLIPSVGPERDYEGVGGWREGDDEAWTTINARGEWPWERHHSRHHSRTASGGGVTTPGDGGYLMMKSTKSGKGSAMPPNSSRTRTPSGPRMTFGDVGYFPLTMAPRVKKNQNPVVE